jgi:two-component system, OmpR family, sensor histidine kinase CiaH
MFKSAKIKLTAWYLLIIMTVSLSFSTLVYTGVSAITKRALDNQRIRIERRIRDMDMFRPAPRIQLIVDEDALIEVRERTLAILTLINFVIFIVAGALGYLLAGRTLKPIEIMLNKQRRFISDAAHELKTPITAMKTDMEVTIRDKNPTLEKHNASIKNAIEEIDKLNSFVNNLLQKSRYDLGNNREKSEIFNIVVLIEGVIKTMEPLSKVKEIKLETELSPVFVEARKTEINELIMNLIDNSIKYTERDGKVIVTTKQSHNNLVITVSDNGIGIAEEEIQRIFEPFYKLDKARTTSHVSGYGLGLAIVKDIVESNNGNIEVKSKLTEGTTIILTLPIIAKPPQVTLSKEQ